MKKLSRRNKEKALIISLALLLVAMMAAFIVPLPYYIESPGGAQDVRTVLSVDGKTDSKDGSYNFTYITMTPATFASLVHAWMTPFTDVYSRNEVTGGASTEDFSRINAFYMETSQNMAEYQALTLAGEDITMDYLGVYVLQIMEDSTFRGILHIADTVTGVNGQRFESSQDLIDYVSKQDLGADVEVTFQSNGKTRTEKGQIIKLENGKNGIGIGLTDHTQVASSHDVAFSTAGIGGPSAGLMFTLSIYTQIADPDLRAGRHIAGSGTIEKDGTVGDIGGIDKKVVSAANSGAEIFFAPDNPVDEKILEVDPKAKNNYQTALEAAKKINTDMVIVPVKTVQDAIDYLKNH
ncbi:PDZ domain-containing protein [Streptococcus merionis]|uniref:PDZ domain-containing protein n=2 Tax=Streptococcus merionis TaxID=400065 RepID=A0A239SVS7_9STRE|nr:PDZ domain-containing protein [Streptococcus merionis]